MHREVILVKRMADGSFAIGQCPQPLLTISQPMAVSIDNDAADHVEALSIASLLATERKALVAFDPRDLVK